MGLAGLFTQGLGSNIPDRVSHKAGGPLSTGMGFRSFMVLPLCVFTCNLEFTDANSVLPTGSQQSQGRFFPGSFHLDIHRVYRRHQRLGHPGSEVLRRLVSSDSISCNKEKLPVLCLCLSAFIIKQQGRRFGMAPEIWNGVGNFLQEKNPNIKMVLRLPAESAILNGGSIGIRCLSTHLAVIRTATQVELIALNLGLRRNAAALIEICSVVVPHVDSRPVVSK
ncbi:hypothetical protein Tco_0623873 [Tanacetum coccineum]|uniref:Uncharacterized protein n=1 Tax=Tanacetum coccineum TaxID=301880 RepID=A0ABQ4WCB3_9ASTR